MECNTDLQPPASGTCEVTSPGRAGLVLRGYLFGLSPLDPAAYGAVTALLALAAALATILPTRRAIRIDPAVTLKAE